TRDEKLLRKADEVFQRCGLPVVRPAEMIGRIDTIQREKEYQRRYIAGTQQIAQARINCAEPALVAAAQVAGERKHRLSTELNRYLADPQHYSCHKLVDAENAPLAVWAVEKVADGVRLPTFRVCAKRKAGTIARALLVGIVRQAVKDRMGSVIITDPNLNEAAKSACADLAFRECGSGSIKAILTGWQSSSDVRASISEDVPEL